MSNQIHKWEVLGTTTISGTEFFQYRCQKCLHVTLSGQPLRMPFSQTCPGVPVPRQRRV